MPADVTNLIEAFRRVNQRPQQVLAFPGVCRQFLPRNTSLTPDDARVVANLMVAVDGGETIELEDEHLKPARVAAAAALLLRGREWLAQNSYIADRANVIMRAALDETALEAGRARHRYGVGPSYLEFAAFLVFENWLASPGPETDRELTLMLISGDDSAANVIASLAFSKRDALGARWWRLLELSVLWAGLFILSPRFGDEKETAGARWLRWARWLLARNLSREPSSVDRVVPLAVAERVEKIEAIQWRERYARDRRPFDRKIDTRISGGLETHFLEIVFGWLLDESHSLPADARELGEWRTLATRLWEHEAWCRVGSEAENTGDYRPMSQLGYQVLGTLARLLSAAKDNTGAADLWRPVFDLGPKGHQSIEHFMSCFFLNLTETTDVSVFVSKWRPMVNAALSGAGWTDRSWYYEQRLERHILGFGNSAALGRLVDHANLIAAMQDAYRSWAEKRLSENEDNIASFCNFLNTEVATTLRLDGLIWVAAALRAESDVLRGRRDYTGSAFVEFLDTLVTEHAAEISNSEEHRQALLELVAAAVSRQFPAALALQDRVKKIL